MAKKQASFNAAAGFFTTPSQPAETSEPQPDLDSQTLQKEKTTTVEPIVTVPIVKKEKRIAITFNIDESLDDKLSRFVFEKKMAKEKISKTQVITDAIINYLK